MELSKNPAVSHTLSSEPVIDKRRREDLVVALAGNPNVGKSTVFNAMTGLKQHTGNWPGKTVTSARGYCTCEGQGYVMVDIPGCYSLTAHSAEEETAGDFICSGAADAVVVVCDAVCLERNMNLALQILDRTHRVVVCVNMMDEASKKHIHIDLKELEKRLQVPVTGTSARNDVGIGQIFRAVKKVTSGEYEGMLSEIGEETAKEKSGPGTGPDREGESPAEYYARRAGEVCGGVIEYESPEYAASDRKKDRIFTGRYTAFPIMFLFLMGVFWLTIVGANYPSALLHDGLFYIEERLFALTVRIGLPGLLREMLVHGMYRVMAWVVSVMLPPMAIFFPLFTILEDSGYLPRIAFNLDKCFKACRSCGKQALTMCMGIRQSF